MSWLTLAVFITSRKDFSRYLDSILTLLRSAGIISCPVSQLSLKHHAGEKRTRDWLVHRGIMTGFENRILKPCSAVILISSITTGNATGPMYFTRS